MNQPIATNRRRIARDRLPEMARSVSLFGSIGRDEVGGSACYGVVVTAAVYSHPGG
jgi:hypothetical protein